MLNVAEYITDIIVGFGVNANSGTIYHLYIDLQ